MAGRAKMALFAMTVAIAATFAAAGPVRAGSPIPLLLPGATAFSLLGHSCGGIHQQALATGFDATSGDPTGVVYLQTRCGGSGKGGGYHSTTYSKWVAVTWDFTGAMVSDEVLASAPGGLDPAFSATDALGNEVYNGLSAINVLPAACAVTNTTYCSYHAWLAQAPGFVPPPTVTSLSTASGPVSGGSSVTIQGNGFLGATAVTFGAAPAASFVVGSDTSIDAVTPAAFAGTVDVTVKAPGGTSSVSNATKFTYTAVPASCTDADMCVDDDGACKLCGSPVSTDSTTVSDALFMLRAAIGTATCNVCVCDVDDSGTVAATDALLTLRFAIGQNVALACPNKPGW